MIFVIDDDRTMAECVALSCRPHAVKIFADAIAAMSELSDALPDLIFLDIMLDGPDGFTFLNELASYPDTAKIPVVLISSLKLQPDTLKNYGVVGVLDKTTMLPADLQKFVQEYAK